MILPPDKTVAQRSHPLFHIRPVEDFARHEHPFMPEYVEGWINENQSVLRRLREQPNQFLDGDGALVEQARKSLDRWWLTNVGTTSGCWVERAVTSSAMLLDWRVARIGRRLKDCDSWEEFWASDQGFWITEKPGTADSDPAYDKARRHAVKAACAFAVEWQRYLLQLLLRPPRDPNMASPDPSREPLAAFNDCYFPCPDSRVARVLADLAHCRPAGAFFEAVGRGEWIRDHAELIDQFADAGWPGQADDWLRLGGRPECRRPVLCPHCYARMVRRLVERIEAGPWRSGRRRSSRLVLLRVGIPTSSMRMDEGRLAGERRGLEFDKWLRLSDRIRDYTPATREEAMVRFVDMEQHLSDTLTPTEIAVARQALRTLLDWAKELGITGGISTHTIGPQGRQYRHELCIVGEIRLRDAEQLSGFRQSVELGGGYLEKAIFGQPIECVLMPRSLPSASRYLVAGTGWGTDLDLVGAEVNAEARRHTHIYGRAGEPAGLRGALAWQPLYLLSGAAFWSRAALLTTPGSYRHYAAFGTWIDELTSEAQFDTRSKKFERSRSVQLGSRRKDPALHLRRRFGELNCSVATVAELAGCHRSTVDKLFRTGRGSPTLVAQVREALGAIQARQERFREVPRKFRGPAEVKDWLKQMGKSQAWLAQQIGWTAVRVTRQLTGVTAWSSDFQYRLHALVRQLAVNGDGDPKRATDHRNVLSAREKRI